MDPQSLQTLADLIRTRRTAALGTLWDGAPFVSMVLYAAAPDFSSFYIHISRLAHHTQDLLQDPRAGLMIAEADTGARNPQTLARVSILGRAAPVEREHLNYAGARSAYLAKHPSAAFNFELQDFSLFRIPVESARYVAGFGKIFNLKLEDFQRAARLKI